MAALEFDFEDVAVELLGAGAKADADTLALAARGDHVKLFPTIVARHTELEAFGCEWSAPRSVETGRCRFDQSDARAQGRREHRGG